jgi:ATP-dependent Lon protease
MAEAKSVPVLFVKDPIVLPGMVVPVALDDAARAAVDAARATESGKLLRLAAWNCSCGTLPGEV